MPSSLLGAPTDRWPLARAVDALVESARLAGVPGLVWIAGAFYPSLNLNLDLVRGILHFVEQTSGIQIPVAFERSSLLGALLPVPALIGDPKARIALVLSLWPLLWAVYRSVAGIARLSDPHLAPPTLAPGPSGERAPRGGQRLRLRAAWRAGKGLGFAALGLWMVLLFLLFGALLVLMGPVVLVVKLLGLSEFSPLFAGLLLPVLFLLLSYAVVLMVLNQLALHSLSHNRRGIASALIHAWRLVRASPMIATRATLLEVALFGGVLLVAKALTIVFSAPALSSLCAFLLLGFAGVTRAGFWARTYRALGGLSSADHVPGL